MLKDFAKAIALTLYNTDKMKWPTSSRLAISPVGHLYAAEYMEQLSTFVCQYSTNDWHKAFSNSLSLLKVSHHIIDGLEKAQMDKGIIAKYILMIIEVSAVLSGGKSLISKNHLLLSDAEIEVIYDCFEFIENKQDLNDLLKLSILLWAYADALFFQGREMCCEYHGLYTTENGIKVLIRDYKNYNPVELWPEISFDLDFSDIRIVTFHKNDFSIMVDVYNNIHVQNSSFKDSCIAGLLFIDGKKADANVIKGLIECFMLKLEKQTRYVNQLNTKELYKKYIYLFWYRKKYLADCLQLPWKPSEDVLNLLEMNSFQDTRDSFVNTSMELLREKYDYSAYI